MLLVPEKLQAYRSQLKKAIEEGRPAEAAELATRLSPTRVARLLVEAPTEAVLPCLAALPPERAGRIVAQLPPDFAAALFERMRPGPAAALFQEIPLDNAADVLELLDEPARKGLLKKLPDDFRQALMELTKHPADSAGGVMTPHFLAIDKGKTVGDTLDALLSAPPELERGSYVYVVDDRGRPEGVLSLKDLARFSPETLVEQAMHPNVIAVHVDDSAIDAARLIRNRRFMMVPVLDADDILVGVVTFDDAMDILAEDVAHAFAGFGAGVADESFFTPPLEAVRKRLPWMAANVFLNLGAVAVITGFESTIAQVAILAAFLPMITDMGGNVGIQSLSVAIRSIALDEVRLRDFWQAVRKELAIGLINGAALGTLFATVAYFWQGNPLIGLLAGIALACNVLLAGVVGGCLPFLIKRLGKDPAMMTGPILTTITDITGVSVYLGLCTLFLASLLAA